MWLIISLIAAIIATFTWALMPKNYKLDFLAMMLWGLTIMVLVDFIMGYEGGPFIETRTDGLIPDATILGLVMLIPVFMVWGISLIKQSITK